MFLPAFRLDVPEEGILYLGACACFSMGCALPRDLCKHVMIAICCYVAKVGLKLLVLLSESLQFWDYRL